MEIIATWLPPAAIIAVILFTSNQLNKRINDSNKRTDDLRSDMRSEMNSMRSEMNGLRSEMNGFARTNEKRSRKSRETDGTGRQAPIGKD